MTFETGAAERMRLDSSGNLGIGTSSPAYKLDVRGSTDTSYFNVTSTADANATTLRIGTDATAAFINATGSSSGTLQLRTYGTTRATLDTSGNLGLGVTPSAWGASYKVLQLPAGAISADSTAVIEMRQNSRWSGSANVYVNNGFASNYYQYNGAHAWFTAPSGTAGNTISFTQAMTLDASGRLLVGATSSYLSQFKSVVEGATSGSATLALGLYKGGTPQILNGDVLGNLYFYGIDNDLSAGNDNLGGRIHVEATSDWTSTTTCNAAMVFSTHGNTSGAPSERARITAGGYSKFSNTGAYQDSAGSYHEFRSNGAAGEYTAIIGNSTSTDANAFGVRILYGNADPNGTGNQFLNCADWNGSSIVTRAEIRSNGGLANYQANNVDLSDARTKKDIIPAASMWGKVSALEIVTYKYNDQTHDDVNLGVIAQQVETVEPVWVDADGFGDTPEDGVPIKTVYTKDITFAAIKALQEAMARIEQLEAKVAALESK